MILIITNTVENDYSEHVGTMMAFSTIDRSLVKNAFDSAYIAGKVR